MLEARVAEELKLVTRLYGASEISADQSWLLIHEWVLPAGWNRASTPLVVRLLPAYPSAPPDNFYAAADLRTASGSTPANTSQPGDVSLPPGAWLCFSWHHETNWRASTVIANGDNLATFLSSVAQRLGEVS